MMNRAVPFAAALAALAAAAGPAAVRAQGVTNLIVMIADGAGANTLEATRLYTGQPLAVDDRTFAGAWMSVHPLDTRNDAVPGPEGVRQDAASAYSPARAWATGPADTKPDCPKGYPEPNAGHEWHCRSYPDSANTMTSMMTGVKTYNNAINVDGRGQPVRSVPEAAVAAGRLAGVVTSAQITDATPASGGGAHNVSRVQRREIAAEMFSRGLLSVIGGAGNPDFNDDGQADSGPKTCFTRPDDPNEWIGADVWADLKSGKPTSRRVGPGWTLVQERADIQAIAEGRVPPPDRLAMIARAFCGLKQYRSGLRPGTEDPVLSEVVPEQPTLAELTRAALARLGTGPRGFYLMVEESNTDRAAHANNLGRVIEAEVAFDEALRAVIAWVDRPDTAADWSNTLLVVTADHDHLLLGPDAERVPFQPVQPDGPDADRLPDHRWFSNSHSNQLVPIFVRGAGARSVLAAAKRRDRSCDASGQCFGRGRYLDQADLGRTLLRLMDAPPR